MGEGTYTLAVGRTALLALLLLSAACVERRLHIRTDPEGAAVRVNGRDVGPSPAVWRFHHYGTVLVEASHPGHEPEQRVVELKTPWYQRPVADFFADVLLPKRIRDDHEVSMRLTPLPDMTEEQVAAGRERLAAAARTARSEARKRP